MSEILDHAEKLANLLDSMEPARANAAKLAEVLEARRATLHDELHEIVGRILYVRGIPSGDNFTPADFKREAVIRDEIARINRALHPLKKAVRPPKPGAVLEAEGGDIGTTGPAAAYTAGPATA